MKRLLKNQRGDTIVEVLIAITLLAFVLTGAYLTAGNSFNNIQSAQERDEATYIANTQIEILRAEANNAFFSGSQYDSFETANHGFCFDLNSSNVNYGNNPYHIVTGPCTAASGSSGELMNILSGPNYQVAISSGTNACTNLTPDLQGNVNTGCSLSTSQTTVYVVQVSWLQPGGAPQQLQEYYRLGGTVVTAPIPGPSPSTPPPVPSPTPSPSPTPTAVPSPTPTPSGPTCAASSVSNPLNDTQLGANSGCTETIQFVVELDQNVTGAYPYNEGQQFNVWCAGNEANAYGNGFSSLDNWAGTSSAVGYTVDVTGVIGGSATDSAGCDSWSVHVTSASGIDIIDR